MGKTNFSDDFKRDAVHQITVRGYAVREVSERLGVSTHSLYQWMKKYPAQGKPTTDYEAENRRLKGELARMTEERDKLKSEGLENDPVNRFPRTTPRRTSRESQSGVRVHRRKSCRLLHPFDVSNAAGASL